MSALQDLLSQYRDLSKEQRGKGTLFELLIKDFLQNDPTFAPQFSEVWTFAEWAKLEDKYQNDVGIDLVAKRVDEDGFCAIQCKFYAEDYRMQKGDIDSFFTASGKKEFTSRLIFDTTRSEWGTNAESALEGQSTPVQRIGLADLENSAIDWSVYTPNNPVQLKSKKSLRPHQVAALKAVQEGLEHADRGKLIMACGTGKTFTALKMAEQMAGVGKRVLFLVPSLSLMSQTITEWTTETETPLNSFAVCSDAQVGKRKESDDLSDITIHDLAYPATTDAKKLAAKCTTHDETMTVVFSTYQSIQVISDAQQKYGLSAFDLIICDEAHRTTGATLAGADESNFVKIHDNGFIKGNKRIYMTATPRIFSDTVKTKANEVDATLASMDNPKLYGETLFELNFSYAVQNGLLTDYKVIVLAMDESIVSESMQKRFTDMDNELILDDMTKIIGCYRALNKLDVKEDVVADPTPMKRAVAFCRDIKSSKRIKEDFSNVVNDYLTHQTMDNTQGLIQCETEHVDGTYNATARNARLSWLKADTPDNICRILSNARCLSEGVDVPALDAILFLHPRKSQIDVVQSVGRVMRRAEGKNMGYVILPIGVPAGVPAEEALNDNEKYKVVWQILNALRAHDDRMDATINKIDMGVDISGQIEIVAVGNILPEQQTKAESAGIGQGGGNNDDNGEAFETEGGKKPTQTSFDFDEFQKAILARIVKKCGTREYWGDWANGIARIAQTHITRITAALADHSSPAYQSFSAFLDELRDDLNESITETEAVEMLAQHIITKPIFDALFEGYSFTAHNPVSKAMQGVLETLQGQNLEKEQEELQDFYDRVKRQIGDIKTADAKQKIILDLYDKFFKNAFPRMTERLGIVYTPVQVVDFIIHSINDVLQSEFSKTLGDKDVHIIDPFTGTGTFITRLLQSGLISREQLAYKYQNEIHANEIVLLAYYIAAINIESVYHDLMGAKDGEYQPFNGICLTDTFQLYEKDDLVSNMLEANSSRRKRQKKLNIKVIMGNPPYSAGQDSANSDNANIDYPCLDQRIADSYLTASQTKGGKRSSYDSYIRAIRWASDRLAGEDGNGTGVIGFVSNAGFIDSASADGLRKCLAEEFASIYVFHLRGNQRTSGELSRKEGGKIFGSGSRAPIAISILVRNPQATEHGRIVLHDIGDYLTREEKLAKIAAYQSINGITAVNGWLPINPDKHGDWVNQRDDSFGEFISLGDKKDKSSVTVFSLFSNGVVSSRDEWVFNYSGVKMRDYLPRMIDFYNAEVNRYEQHCAGLDPKEFPEVKTFVKKDVTKISWGGGNWQASFKRFEKPSFERERIRQSLYRPFTKIWHYGSKTFNHSFYSMPKIFPNAIAENRVISVTGRGATKEFSALMADTIPDLEMISKGQCFPLSTYEGENIATEPNRTEPNRTEIIPQTSSITNRVICLSVTGNKGFSVLMTDQIPDLHLIGDAQCFPLFLFEEEAI